MFGETAAKAVRHCGMLADDLDRFAADRPIRAGAPRSWERAFKLARRRPVTTSVLALSGFVALASRPSACGTSPANPPRRRHAASKRADPDSRHVKT